MAEDWAQWEGQLVADEFRLGRYIGGTEHSGVFLTEFGGERAAIKLLAGEPRHQWGSELTHPHLIRILRTGRWEPNNTPLHYVVMEYADEVLAQIEAEDRTSPTRALIDDLPLFAATRPASGSAPQADAALTAVVEGLKALNPDEMSPRDALDALYALRAKLAAK